MKIKQITLKRKDKLRYSPLTSWVHLTTWVWGWSIVISNAGIKKRGEKKLEEFSKLNAKIIQMFNMNYFVFVKSSFHGKRYVNSNPLKTRKLKSLFQTLSGKSEKWNAIFLCDKWKVRNIKKLYKDEISHVTATRCFIYLMLQCC